jgi:hypothetical protein
MSQTTLGPCKSYEEEEHKMPHFRLGICSQQPFGTMIQLCVFSPKNFVHDFIVLIHLKSYAYNWGICKSSSYNSWVAQFSISYLFGPS